MTDKCAYQLSVVKDIISSNPDWHVIVGGDFNFNVDIATRRALLARRWLTLC
jgi:hypothetical protein